MPRRISRCYQFTHFHELDLEKIYNESKEAIKYIGGQIEICPKTQRQHLQGLAIFYKNLGISTVQKYLLSHKNDAGKYDLHVEACLSNSVCLKAYSSKTETRAASFNEFGIFDFYSNNTTRKESSLSSFIEDIKEGRTREELILDYSALYLNHYNQFNELIDNYKPVKIQEPLEWRPFQKLILDICRSKPHDRHIYWLYDEHGNIGKSTLFNYLISYHNAFLSEGGKTSDVAYSYNNQPIVLFDFPRSAEDYLNYPLLESFKNRRLTSNKYHSKMKFFDPVHVIVAANFMPDMDKLSKDRWIIFKFDKNKDFKILDSDNYKINLRLNY